MTPLSLQMQVDKVDAQPALGTLTCLGLAHLTIGHQTSPWRLQVYKLTIPNCWPTAIINGAKSNISLPPNAAHSSN
jgi:hypothetical protein